ncbi:MAG: hypothetical protein JNK05_05925 [Myxococcales bacterium]|nr:hypothetical protein [Myxococcales bacterium]
MTDAAGDATVEDVVGPDGPTRDTGVLDGDAASVEVSAPDAIAIDAAVVDSPSSPDSGGPVDAGICAANQIACAGRCVNISNDPLHCGGCGNECSALNGTPSCEGGSCRTTCNPGFGDCDAARPGCETRLGTTMNCERCGGSCNVAAPICRVGMGCVSACPAGTTQCGASCTNTTNDVRNCGGCGLVCDEPPNTVATCSANTCGTMCVMGFGNCDRDARNGCETNLRTNALHCGRCDNACVAISTRVGACLGGACLSCRMGQTLCTTVRSENFGQCCAAGCAPPCEPARS